MSSQKQPLKIKVGSDFSGVGAFDQALMRVGLPYETIFSCDMDKYARESYIANYGEPKYYPENVYDREIPEESLDIYMTSPPCQAFSIAGKRKGEGDDRGVLFYNSHEFIVKNKPRYFIFENVKGLLSDDKGRTFQRWIDYLAKSVNGQPVIFPHEESAGYHVYWKVLNSKNYGVPQNRERVFIIGIRDDEDNKFVFPPEENLNIRLRDVLEDNPNNIYNLSAKRILTLMENPRHIGFTDPDDKESANCIIAGYHKQPTDGEYLIDDKYFLSDKMIDALTAHQRFNAFKPTKGEGIVSCITARVHKMGNADNYIEEDLEKYYLKPETVNKLIEYDRKNKEKGNGFGAKFHNPEEDNMSALKCGGGGCDDLIKVKSATKQGFEVYEEGDSVNFSVPSSETRRGRVGKEVAQTLDTACNQGIIQVNNPKHSNDRVYSDEGVSPTLNTMQGGNRQPFVKLSKEAEVNQLNQSKESGGKQPYQQNRVYDVEGINPALNSGQETWGGNIINTPRVRRLTPRECFRLQDFPDTFKFVVSDTQLYKQAGNSITVAVLAKIINRLELLPKEEVCDICGEKSYRDTCLKDECHRGWIDKYFP